MKPISLGISLWLFFALPNALVAESSLPSARDLVSASQSDKIADLGVKLAATDNREQALLLFDRAVELAPSARNPTDRITTLVAIATRMAAVSEKERALLLLEEAVKINPNANYPSLARIALEIAKLGEHRRSRQLFNRAVKLHRTEAKKEYPTQDPYYTDAELVKIIALIARSGQLERALQVARTLPGKLSKAEALNEIAGAAIARGKTATAKKMLQETLQAVSSIEDSAYVYESNGSCGNDKFALLAEVAKNLNLVGELDRVLDIANNVYSCSSANGEFTQNYQLSVYTGILNSFGGKQVKQIWNSASKITAKIDKLEIWAAIAVKLIEVGETDLGLQVAEKVAAAENPAPVGYLPYSSYKEKELTKIAFKFAEVGETDKSRQIVQKIAEPLRTDISVLLAIPDAKKLYQQGREREAKDLLAKKLRSLDASKFTDDEAAKSAAVRREIAVELTKLKELELSFQVQQSISDKYWQLETLNRMASASIDAGDLESAFQVADRIDSPVDLAHFSENIAPKLTNKEQVEVALNIIPKIGKDQTIDASWKDRAIAAIAPRLIAVGEVDKGLALGTEIKSGENKLEFALEIAKLGKLEEARQIIQALPDDTAQKAEAIADLAVRYLSQY